MVFNLNNVRIKMEKWSTKTLGTQPLEKMSAFFNKRAESYREVHLGHVGIESKQIIASFLPSNVKSIIDFGIGTGLELEEIFKRFPSIEVIGLDVAENMLKLLRENYPTQNIKLHNDSYLTFDFGKLLYDVALSVMTLHHYTHEVKRDLYRKVYGSIKPNGLYIECDYMLSEHQHENPQEMEDFYFSEYERLKEEQGITDDGEYHYDTPCTVYNQKKVLVEAGFVNVREVWQKENTVILLADKQAK